MQIEVRQTLFTTNGEQCFTVKRKDTVTEVDCQETRVTQHNQEMHGRDATRSEYDHLTHLFVEGKVVRPGIYHGRVTDLSMHLVRGF